jgi:hypothetical protein
MTTPKARQITHEIVECKVGDLFVDPGVQRTLGKTRVETMAKNFDPDALGVLTTSWRSARRIHVIDGQHRVNAALIAKYDGPILTNQYKGLSIPEEAALFRKLNTAKKPTAVDHFLLACVEQDPDAVQLAGYIARHGWSVAAYNGEGKLSAIGSLERVYNVSPEAADAALAVLTAAYGHRPVAVQGALVEGVGRLIAKHGPNINLDDLAKRLAGVPGGPDGLVGNARGQSLTSTGTLWVQVARVVTRLYNTKRRSTAIPDWA